MATADDVYLWAAEWLGAKGREGWRFTPFVKFDDKICGFLVRKTGDQWWRSDQIVLPLDVTKDSASTAFIAAEQSIYRWVEAEGGRNESI